MDRKEKSPPNTKDIRTILGEEAHFNGVLSFEGAVRIDGKLDGEIVSNGTLFVGEKSEIQADIRIGSIVIGGKVRGNIIATTRLEILSNAEIFGNIQTPLLKIEEGAIFQGTCEMCSIEQEPKSISYVDNKESELLVEHPINIEEIA